MVTNGYNETGSIVFTLSGPAGFTTVTQSDTISGNGTYTASATLPTTGTAAGTYTWHVSYAGDRPTTFGAADGGGTVEQTVVTAAATMVATGDGPATLSRSNRRRTGIDNFEVSEAATANVQLSDGSHDTVVLTSARQLPDQHRQQQQYRPRQL